MAGDKIDVSFEINTDSEKLLEQIVEKYDLPDKSKALRCLLDYVEEKEEWDEMFATVLKGNRCGKKFLDKLDNKLNKFFQEYNFYHLGLRLGLGIAFSIHGLSKFPTKKF